MGFRRNSSNSRSSNSRSGLTPIGPDPIGNAANVSKALGHTADLVIRKIPAATTTGNISSISSRGASSVRAVVLFLEGLADEEAIRRYIIDPLLAESTRSAASAVTATPAAAASGATPATAVTGELSAIKSTAHEYLEPLIDALLEGQVLLFTDRGHIGKAFVMPGWSLRPIMEPPSERVVRGPREGFTETLKENIAMVRRWVRAPELRVAKMQIGTRTRTDVAIMYLEDVANPDIVAEVHKRLSAIKIDSILEAGYLEQLISDNRKTLFPLTQATERSDKVTSAILEGRIAILVDKSASAIIAPTTVNELYQSPEDYYYDFWLGSLLRGIRLLGNNLAIALPGLYIALAAVNSELLPTQLALNIAASRLSVPFPILIEVLLVELIIEIFREAGLRLPSTVAQTLGIVAGVVLGIAAAEIAVISDATLIVSVITAVASFSGPNFQVGISWRWLKYFMIFGGAFMGLFGIVMVGCVIVSHMATLQSFGVSYLAPWAPLQPDALVDAPIRQPIWTELKRASTWRTKNRRRMGDTKGEDNP